MAFSNAFKVLFNFITNNYLLNSKMEQISFLHT